MILTIRTDKPEAELGLFDGGQKVAYETWQAHRQLAETLHQKMQEILSVKGLTPESLSGIVVYAGPGSFTGLRIGASVANALAYGLTIPVVDAQGKDWIRQGIDQLLEGKGQKFIVPDYGSPVHVTQPKK